MHTLPHDTPLAILQQGKYLLLFDHLVEHIECAQAAELDTFFSRIDAHQQQGHYVVLYASYESGDWFLGNTQPIDTKHSVADSNFPPLTALAFTAPTRFNDAEFEAWIAQNSDDFDAPAGVYNLRASLDQASHAQAVERIRQYIHEGDCYQVNLTFPIQMQCFGNSLKLFSQLRQQQPTAHGAYVRLHNRTLISLSPELFVERWGDTLTSRPMKGTAARHTDPQLDQAARQDLFESEKDRAENVMIVDLIRNDLGRISRTGAVGVDRLFEIEAYPTVWQMTSTISADAPRATLHDVMSAMFPCGSITGAPKRRAMEIIRELENAPRDIYTGSIGLIQPDGDFSLNVAIRTVSIQSDGTAQLGVGGGITWASNALQEYEECLVKARFLTRHDPGFSLIETMRAENQRIDLLDLHLARLQQSAACFAFQFNRDAIQQQLQTQLAHLTLAPHRVRLVLSKTGQIDVQCAPLGNNDSFTHIRLAPQPIKSHDLFRLHKTTWRPQYDDALAKMHAEPNCFDWLFLNEQGTLAEGARSNLFFKPSPDSKLASARTADVFLTPPLNCGVLPGVLRQSLINAGRAHEHVLTLDDLSDGEIYMGNALRGLIKVSLRH